MPTPTYIALANITLGSSASSVSFSSIPATYRDVVLVADYAGSANAGTPLSINGSTANLSRVLIYAVPSEANTTTASDVNLGGIYLGNRTLSICQFMDYSATDKHKTILLKAGTTPNTSEVVATAGRWASTSAITTIGLAPSAGTFSAGSTFALYGIAS
jgi:hypothetical protein